MLVITKNGQCAKSAECPVGNAFVGLNSTVAISQKTPPQLVLIDKSAPSAKNGMGQRD